MIQRIVRKALWGLFFFAFFEKFFVPILTSGGAEAVILNYISHMNRSRFEFHVISHGVVSQVCEKKFHDLGFIVHLIRLKSSSGGMITILAEHVLDQGGVVYGVAMSDDCYAAEFIRVTDRNGLEKIRGSKYLQAKVGDTFRRVKEDLESGRTVLFTGRHGISWMRRYSPNSFRTIRTLSMRETQYRHPSWCRMAYQTMCRNAHCLSREIHHTLHLFSKKLLRHNTSLE